MYRSSFLLENEIVIDHKKVSSFHCSLQFDKVGEYWNLTIDNPSKNRVFVDDSDELVDLRSVISPFEKPVALSFIFPKSEHPVDTLLVSPPRSITDTVELSADSPISREEKRMKREMRVLDKKNSEWETSYNDETTKLMETENSLLREIAMLERSLETKKTSVAKLKNDIVRIESEMKEKDKFFAESMDELKQAHAERNIDFTQKVSDVVNRLGTLTAEKNLLLQKISHQ